MSVILFPSTLRSPATSASCEAGAGLTSSECFAIAAAARDLPGPWSAQWDEDEAGHASMALLPDQENAADDLPTFVAWREGGRLRLCMGHHRFFSSLGEHTDVGSLVGTLRRSLDRW